MREPNDWRLTNQERYLKGATLAWQPYVPASPKNDHDHCEFCFARFMQQNYPDTLAYLTALRACSARQNADVECHPQTEHFMNLPSKKSLLTATAFVVALVAGCATTQPIPEMSQPQSSALAIDVLVKPPMGFGSRDPVQVYFVRIDGTDGLMQHSIIRSNYVKGSRAYLLNARPGTYAAVASTFLTPGLQQGTYITYFPGNVLEHTQVEVRDGEVAFMGAYVLGTSVGLDGADEVQTHYKNVIAPGQATGSLAMSFSGAVHYRGSLLERKADEQTRREFFQKAKDDLAGSGWVTLIK